MHSGLTRVKILWTGLRRTLKFHDKSDVSLTTAVQSAWAQIMLMIKSNKSRLLGRKHHRVVMSDIVIKLGISCLTPSRPVPIPSCATLEVVLACPKLLRRHRDVMIFNNRSKLPATIPTSLSPIVGVNNRSLSRFVMTGMLLTEPARNAELSCLCRLSSATSLR